MATTPEEIEQVAKSPKVETPEVAREAAPAEAAESIKKDIMAEESQVVSQTKIEGTQFVLLINLIF